MKKHMIFDFWGFLERRKLVLSIFMILVSHSRRSSAGEFLKSCSLKQSETTKINVSYKVRDTEDYSELEKNTKKNLNFMPI